MANLSIGSRGDDVKKLQNALIKANYNVGSTGADGVFGTATQNAVKAYQQANGLSVDGVAGEQTLGKLLGGIGGNALSSFVGSGSVGGAVANAALNAIPKIASYAIAKKYDPEKSESYQSAMAALQAANQNAPTYTNSYETQLKDLYDQIVGRDKFKYDINADELYKQYARQYADQGRTAMMDIMGQAAALTGGYGSSYGQSVGQQQYAAFLKQLGDIVPQLEQRAYDRYNDEGNDMVQQYAMLGDMADDEYAKYIDEYNRWLTERDYAKDAADTAYSKAYQKYLDKLSLFDGNIQSLLNFLYQQRRDAVADSQWQAEFNLAQQQAASKSSGGSGGSSGGGKSSGGDAVDIPDSAIISNRHNESSGWIEVGGSRWTYQEVLNGVNSGKFIETYDPKTNKVTYKKA